MKKLMLSMAGAALLVTALAATVAAAGPAPSPAGGQGGTSSGGRGGAAGAGQVIPPILGLTQAQVMDLRHDGQSLADIAAQQKVDPQKLVDALVARWTSRIDARVAAGALTTEQATALKANAVTSAKDMVSQSTVGGMQGASVGAGPSANRAGTGPRGRGTATGTCDGSGPHGAGRP